MKFIPVAEFWPKHAPLWQAKLDDGEKLTISERHRFRECMSAWSDNGCSTAGKWTRKEAGQFKRIWQEQLRAWEQKEKQGEPFTLEERKDQQISLGMWWWTGYAESADWDEEAWKRFRMAAVRFADADRKVVEARDPKRKNAKQTAASKQLWDQLEADYLDRPLRHRQMGEFQQGAWKRLGERETELGQRNQRELEAEAARRIKPWEKLSLADYEFSGWAKNLGGRELQLATLYEYARESRKLRGLLATGLIRDAGNNVGVMPTGRGSFDGLDDYEAQESPLGRWFLVLCLLADELVSNTPFALIAPERIERALYHCHISADGRTQRLWCRLDDQAAGYFWYHPPVSLALVSNVDNVTDSSVYANCSTTTGEVLPDNSIHSKRGRTWLSDSTRGDYGENMVISINWKECADSELVESFKQYVATHRPAQKFPEPKPRKRQGRSTLNRRALYAALDGLAAMRLLTHYSKEDDAHQNYKGIVANPTRRDQLKALGHGARKEFSEQFPFKENPANHGDWR